MYFGCLFFFLFITFLILVSLVGNVLNGIGSVVGYIWDTVCNWFRPKDRRKDARKPFRSYAESRTEHSATDDSHPSPQGKIFSADDGEYIDFEEI